MICPILFIRKPEEAECLKERCSFWVKEEMIEAEDAVPERFRAVITGPPERHQTAKPKPQGGKCAILTIAEKFSAGER
jgi:hypothetical protein